MGEPLQSLEAHLLLSQLEYLQTHVGNLVNLARLVFGSMGPQGQRNATSDLSQHPRPQNRKGRPRSVAKVTLTGEAEEATEEETEEPDDWDLSEGRGPLLPNHRTDLDHIDDDQQYTVKEAAEALGVSEQTIRIHARKEKLVGTKEGKGGRGKGQYRFSGVELKRYHHAKQQEP